MSDKVTLLEWGPAPLYKWLFTNWNNSTRLSEESKNAMRLLYAQPIDDGKLLKQMTVYSEYEKLIMALSVEDFGFC